MSQTTGKAGGGWVRTILVGVACLIVGTICGSALASSSKPSTPTKSDLVPVTAAPVKSTPTPRQVVSLNGQGSKVLPINLEQGSYRVDWTAQGPNPDNFILHIHLGAQDQGVVNQIPPNPASGQTFFESPQADTYNLEVKAATLTWTVTFTPI
jgi:hypothetical protein